MDTVSRPCGRPSLARGKFPKTKNGPALAGPFSLMPPVGVEPTYSGFSVQRLNQLSYSGGVVKIIRSGTTGKVGVRMARRFPPSKTDRTGTVPRRISAVPGSKKEGRPSCQKIAFARRATPPLDPGRILPLNATSMEASRNRTWARRHRGRQDLPSNPIPPYPRRAHFCPGSMAGMESIALAIDTFFSP